MSESHTGNPKRYNNGFPTDELLLSKERVTELALTIGDVIRRHNATPLFRDGPLRCLESTGCFWSGANPPRPSHSLHELAACELSCGAPIAPHALWITSAYERPTRRPVSACLPDAQPDLLFATPAKLGLSPQEHRRRIAPRAGVRFPR